MDDDSRRCERCGQQTAESFAFSGVCPRCMLELGFESRVGSTATVPDRAVSASAALGPEGAMTFARYRIVRLIGQGGMGAVYEAEQDQPSRTVALKIIKPGISNPKLLRRFEQESEALGRLQHPGIAHIYEAGTADTGFGPQPYFAMELIRGRTLTDYAQTSLLTERARLDIVARIAEAAHHAHQRGLIHRDLKPANILVDETGQPKILDFGVARVTDGDAQATNQTEVGQLLGTLAYMSPEQVLGDSLEIDTRTDVYALGVILYELLAGRLPYTIGRLPETIRAIREEEPARLGAVSRRYRGDVETIVATTLEKDKSRRYGSAGELAADIRRYLRDEPIVARSPSLPYQLQKFARRNRALVAAAAAVFVVLVAGIVVATMMARLELYKADAELSRQKQELAERERENQNKRAAIAEGDLKELKSQLIILGEARVRLQREIADAQRLANDLQSKNDLENKRAATAEQESEDAKLRLAEHAETLKQLQGEADGAQRAVTALTGEEARLKIRIAENERIAAEAVAERERLASANAAERARADAEFRERAEAMKQLENSRNAKALEWLNQGSRLGKPLSNVNPGATLISPVANQQVPQNVRTACTPKESPIGGVEILFDWVEVRGATRYRLIAGNVGAVKPIVSVEVTDTKYKYVTCSGTVGDHVLKGWFWVVQAFVDRNWGPMSLARPFEFLSCRLPDGQFCGAALKDRPPVTARKL